MVLSSFIRPLSKLFQLSWHERFWLLRAWLALPAVQWRLKRNGYQRTRQAMEVPVAPVRALSDEAAARFAAIVALAARRHVFRLECLPRSLWTWNRLRKLGCPCELRLGVIPSDASDFEAHAWVELDGQPLNERHWPGGGESHLPFTAASRSEHS